MTRLEHLHTALDEAGGGGSITLHVVRATEELDVVVWFQAGAEPE